MSITILLLILIELLILLLQIAVLATTVKVVERSEQRQHPQAMANLRPVPFNQDESS